MPIRVGNGRRKVAYQDGNTKSSNFKEKRRYANNHRYSHTAGQSSGIVREYIDGGFASGGRHVLEVAIETKVSELLSAHEALVDD